MSSSDGGDFDRERAERAARTAEKLLSITAGSIEGDLDQELRDVASEDALAVLGAVMRQLASLLAAEQLREFEPADVDAVPDDDDDDHDAAADDDDDDDLPADPWETGDAIANGLEHGATLAEALASQRTVPDLLRAIRALDQTEFVAMALERALREMADRQRPSGSGR